MISRLDTGRGITYDAHMPTAPERIDMPDADARLAIWDRYTSHLNKLFSQLAKGEIIQGEFLSQVAHITLLADNDMKGQ